LIILAAAIVADFMGPTGLDHQMFVYEAYAPNNRTRNLRNLA